MTNMLLECLHSQFIHTLESMLGSKVMVPWGPAPVHGANAIVSGLCDTRLYLSFVYAFELSPVGNVDELKPFICLPSSNADCSTNGVQTVVILSNNI